MVAVQNRKIDALTLSGDLAFCGSVCSESIDAVVSVDLVHVIKIRIALRFWG